MDPIICYLHERALLEHAAKARKLRCWFILFVVHGRNLYKQSYSMPLHCLYPSKMDFAFREVYEGIYGSYMEVAP